jgi:hypothetical protein
MQYLNEIVNLVIYVFKDIYSNLVAFLSHLGFYLLLLCILNIFIYIIFLFFHIIPVVCK